MRKWKRVQPGFYRSEDGWEIVRDPEGPDGLVVWHLCEPGVREQAFATAATLQDAKAWIDSPNRAGGSR